MRCVLSLDGPLKKTDCHFIVRKRENERANTAASLENMYNAVTLLCTINLYYNITNSGVYYKSLPSKKQLEEIFQSLRVKRI